MVGQYRAPLYSTPNIEPAYTKSCVCHVAKQCWDTDIRATLSQLLLWSEVSQTILQTEGYIWHILRVICIYLKKNIFRYLKLEIASAIPD